jgi:CO/xanthine dehydrogenase Mo-binding subunit
LQAPPDPGSVDAYLTVHADGTVTVRTGRVEIGQGSTTGLARRDAAIVRGRGNLPGNQLEGNLVMGASRALKEEVAFGRRRPKALDWVSYPILRFAESPAVSVKVVQRADLVPTGSGEPGGVPVAAAIANAFFDATGVRIRTAPMTPGRVRATLAAVT